MGRGINWSRESARRRTWAHGTESAGDGLPAEFRRQSLKPRKSKAELRAEADAAFKSFADDRKREPQSDDDPPW